MGLGPCLVLSVLPTWLGSWSSRAPARPDSSHPVLALCCIASHHLPSMQLERTGRESGVGVGSDGRFLATNLD